MSLSTEAIFLVSISGRSGEAKNGFIFEIKFWLRVWSQLLSFLEFVASNSRLACLFFRPTPDGSRQVVYQAGKTIALCKFTELMQ